MLDIKMTGDLCNDAKLVHESISRLYGMLEYLEKECIEKDKGKTATDAFIYINNMKSRTEAMVETSKQLLRVVDIQQYGELSKYIRPYLG